MKLLLKKSTASILKKASLLEKDKEQKNKSEWKE